MTIPPATVAFDFDGVVADTFRLFVRMAREIYGYGFDYEDITEYEFLKCIDMDERHALEIIAVLTNEPHEIDLYPNEGAPSVLQRLTCVSNVLVVTARPDPAPIELWFKRHMPGIPQGCLRVEATGVNTAKLQVLRRHHVTHFVEDRLDTCHLLRDAGITPVVFDQPWNRKPHPFLRVGTWTDVDRLIDWRSPADAKSPRTRRTA
ncbi:MAG TPA: haloacid dehalogenase [Deltaproteobacteria bacterium]|nr:haloacid dehalogenase [Deltaproteobacteria bacterium]